MTRAAGRVPVRWGRRPAYIGAAIACVLALTLSLAIARIHRGGGDRFDLPPESKGAQVVELAGGAFVVNVWATWCTGCRVEVGALHALSRQAGLPVYGVNVGDLPEDIDRWFARFGDPYRAHLDDAGPTILDRHRVQALPVTFVVGRDREIRLRIDGALTSDVLQRRVLPALRSLGS